MNQKKIKRALIATAKVLGYLILTALVFMVFTAAVYYIIIGHKPYGNTSEWYADTF